MTILSDDARINIWATYMQWLSQRGISTALSKADVLEAVANVDDGIDDNQAMVDSFVGELVSADLPTEAKNHLFAIVLARRLEDGI